MERRTNRACQVCGKPFYGSSDCFYCLECAEKKKSDAVMRIRTCQDCGIEFFGGPRAKRCPECAYLASKEDWKRHKKSGTARPIGSVDKCVICGSEYIVNSGRQKYCSDKCQRIGVLEWQREHKRGYGKASGQDEKRKERREAKKKICVYCMRSFYSDRPTNTCSDYCRSEQRKLLQCIKDINRGQKRDLQKYERKREEYRARVKTENGK